ncbi:phosphoribosyltransferase family protein [Actinomadura viridis]|uniref:Phosphoribosyl transferase n=1 Tax=Actinomadura viridis TaxID=58110 RepID=A0A931DE24_9ACTN|nr:phosphoribosyltransferase family protein [Actinomadura viridis]MBG6086908.1 putative phosphoribosyl transferase [Actinomadura viridis]
MMFLDRTDAGRRLGERLRRLRGEDVVVVGLPRGGVPVAFEVARAMGAPLDVIVVRKLGVPWQPELGMGAIGEGGAREINEEIVRLARVSAEELAAVEEREHTELERRARRFRGDRPRVPLRGRTVIVVDDGIATGSTARAACQVARAQGAARVVLAVPVAPPDWTARLGGDADELVCLDTPELFASIGQFYGDFTQTSDEEVLALLRQAGPEPSGVPGSGERARAEEVEVRAGPMRLAGHLTVPGDARGVVMFAHGSGSSRHSPRNRYVAAELNRAGLATFLFDLLTPEEEYDRGKVFDIGLLARRLVEVTGWVRERPEVRGLRVGYFGASTGAAAALRAAADLPGDVAAVVSRGGRPDLAAPRLEEVTAPTLLIVGGRDDAVLYLNREAQARLHCEHDLAVVPGATHLFEEPGALEAVAALARDWFVGHLAPVAAG